MGVKSEKIEPTKKLLEEFDELIAPAIYDIACITARNEQLEQYESFHRKIEQHLMGLKEIYTEFSKVNDRYCNDKLANDLKDINFQLNRISKDLKEICVSRDNKSSKGRKRVYFAICIELLKIITLCEKHNVSIEWLKIYLSTGGRAEKVWNEESGYAPLSEINIPIPSGQDNSKNWAYKLKETLERSYFSPHDGPILKRNTPEFNKNREEFYNQINSSREYNQMVVWALDPDFTRFSDYIIKRETFFHFNPLGDFDYNEEMEMFALVIHEYNQTDEWH